MFNFFRRLFGRKPAIEPARTDTQQRVDEVYRRAAQRVQSERELREARRRRSTYIAPVVTSAPASDNLLAGMALGYVMSGHQHDAYPTSQSESFHGGDGGSSGGGGATGGWDSGSSSSCDSGSSSCGGC